MISRSQITDKLVEDCRMVIHPGDYTAFLETLAIGLPTICIKSDLNWIRNNIKPDYEQLIKAKILFKNLKKHQMILIKYFIRYKLLE